VDSTGKDVPRITAMDKSPQVEDCVSMRNDLCTPYEKCLDLSVKNISLGKSAKREKLMDSIAIPPVV
jgi:hypothetical protein